MSTPYVVVDSDGRIIRHGVCQTEAFERLGPNALPLLATNAKSQYVKDGALKDMPERPSEFHDFNYETKRWKGNIGKGKALLWNRAKQNRERAKESGCDTPYGRVDTDPASISNISGAATAAQYALINNAEWSIDWTMADNTEVTLTAEQMMEVGLTVLAHVDACHQTGRAIRDAIEAATTLAELQAVDISF